MEQDYCSYTGFINGHEYVNLGLSVKWATCNVGASSPSGYGNYYAWGETKTKSEYTESNSVTYGKRMGSIAGNPKYDVARANWGGTWRMPTKEEIDELVSKCTRKWVVKDGHGGYEVTGPNGRSVFLPSADFRYRSDFDHLGIYGNYWSASPGGDYAEFAYHLCFFNAGFMHVKGGFFGDWYSRDYGLSVRPVSD